MCNVDSHCSQIFYCAWFVQGSDNFDHWKTNLTFDPVDFEDADLGVAVHRGVYETAQVLYARFEPLVAEHLASSPFAKVAFTVRVPLLRRFRAWKQTRRSTKVNFAGVRVSCHVIMLCGYH